MPDDVVQFVRRKDYRLVKELGQGACGKTVLLFDDVLDEHFVCKKYQPYSETQRAALFLNFIREIKLLHQVLHPNIVRVFNYFLYPEQQAGFILMEYIQGKELHAFVKDAPETVGDLFLQAVEGLAHLESRGILHRDIRPQNLLVRDDGVLKIIDLGFGKKVSQSADFSKSISLNWWCPPPDEFGAGRYDFSTEVYFAGKLFEQIISENRLEHFPFPAVLGRMCYRDPAARISSFREVLALLQGKQFTEIDFSISETNAYREFSAEVRQHLTKIESNASYVEDGDVLARQLEDAYRSLMLETTAPDCVVILRCLVKGAFYLRRQGFRVEVLRDFLRVFKASPQEKRRILLANIAATLDAIPRYTDASADDSVPF